MLTIACKEEKKFGQPQPLNKISLKGQQYEGEVLKNKLTTITENSNLDSIWKKTLFDHIEYNSADYDSVQDVYRHTQIPSCFLFTDINQDKKEDLIFQSNGPFFTDSHLFVIFISNKKEGYRTIVSTGQIIDIHIVEEYCCRIGNKKSKHLQVDYFDYGCCDDPWNNYVTGIADIETGQKKLKTIRLESVNSVRERKEKQPDK